MIDETADFEEPVTEASIGSSLIDDCLRFMAVEKIQKEVVFCKCNEKFDMVNSTTILKCRYCDTVCKLKLCKFSFYIKLINLVHSLIHCPPHSFLCVLFMQYPAHSKK